MESLPLPPRPDLAQYRSRAKELLAAVRSGDPDRVRALARRWIAALADRMAAAPEAILPWGVEREVDALVRLVEERGAARSSEGWKLSDAQLVLARAHGFASWPKFGAHIESSRRESSPDRTFETAVDAVVAGDAETLDRLLREHPGLATARSSREHGSTLLHYVSANGVEDYRQVTPPNAVEIARILLEAGAVVDAESGAYGGGSTTLGLVASSAHPAAAGVQDELMGLLLDRGADLEHGSGGRGVTPILAAVWNGQGRAAAYLADRGARLDLGTAIAVGRLDEVVRRLPPDGLPADGEVLEEVEQGFVYACLYGRYDTVRLLLDRGVDTAATEGHGQTGLHYAALGGHLDLVRLLLDRGAPLEARNVWGGTVLGQATWTVVHQRPGPGYLEIVRALLDAGADVREADYPTGDPDVDALLRERAAAMPPNASPAAPARSGEVERR